MAAQYILDISRLFSRRHFDHDTGIDRVERGYLEYFKNHSTCVFLIKYSGFHFIVSHDELDRIFDIPHQPKNTYMSKWRILRAVRKISKQSRLSQNISHYENATFINVGHTGHKPKFWESLKRAQMRVIIMIHDVIPLDYPQFSRGDKISVFKHKFQNWCQYADVILTPSGYSKYRILAWSDTNAEIKVTPLYVPEPKLPTQEYPANAWIILGTIEPRKNHKLLFRVWEDLVEELGESAPQLWIIGNRGWPEPETIDFLDHSALMGKYIFEYGAISDDDLSQKMAQAKGVLFPSECEGFGIPIYEAVLQGKALLAARIPAFEEALGSDADCLLDINDYNIWKIAILGQQRYGNVNAIPSWEAHIEKII